MLHLLDRIRTKLVSILLNAICSLPYFRFIRETRNTQVPITFGMWFSQKVMGKNKHAYWPVSKNSLVSFASNIYAGIETSPGYMPGCYIQGMGKIYIGDYTQIASNVGIVSANHDPLDSRKFLLKEVRIGKYCWLAMGSLIMPGVELGDYTIVGAGSVVTKSFPEGYCIIAGNPAKKIRDLDKTQCILHKSDFEYNGYIPAGKFEEYRAKFLKVDKW